MRSIKKSKSKYLKKYKSNKGKNYRKKNKRSRSRKISRRRRRRRRYRSKRGGAYRKISNVMGRVFGKTTQTPNEINVKASKPNNASTNNIVPEPGVQTKAFEKRRRNIELQRERALAEYHEVRNALNQQRKNQEEIKKMRIAANRARKRKMRNKAPTNITPLQIEAGIGRRLRNNNAIVEQNNPNNLGGEGFVDIGQQGATWFLTPSGLAPR